MNPTPNAWRLEMIYIHRRSTAPPMMVKSSPIAKSKSPAQTILFPALMNSSLPFHTMMLSLFDHSLKLILMISIKKMFDDLHEWATDNDKIGNISSQVR